MEGPQVVGTITKSDAIRACEIANNRAQKIVEALLKPEAYDEKVEKIELMQTHISFIFLTGKYVYKVKKPVNFEFLDFTTLEK